MNRTSKATRNELYNHDYLTNGAGRGICPRCGKKLDLIKLQSGNIFGHSYSLTQVMGKGKLCHYSVVA